MQARGVVPFKKIGGRVFFDAEEVRLVIDKTCSVGGGKTSIESSK